MDTPDTQRLGQLQPITLPAFADDAASLAAQQSLGVGDPADATHTFHPLQSDIENLQHQHQHHLQNASSTDTPAFLRPPRPGEPANNLLITDTPHHTPAQQYQQIRDNDTDNGRLGHLNPQLQQQNESNFALTADMAIKQADHGKDIKCIPHPPDLDSWREKLFNVDGTITLSEEQFLTYFPHIDNVYSHRSTQRYKRKPFVSHYWDCRLKGRPPGTPKSNDPNKKKRKRIARQRDLCDVKIKITEYFPGFVPGLTPSDTDPSFPSELLPGVHALFDHSGNGNGDDRESQPFGILTPNPSPPDGHDGIAGERFFTIQRVNGNGANGKNDGVGGGHRHTLEESDRVKKNSVQRRVLSQARERKRSSPVRISFLFLGVSYLAPEVDSNTALVDLYGFPVKHSTLQAQSQTQFIQLF
ncbi:hypothetical protein SI65_00236 [Aspergillus cristatus]|uniref:Uncharacterized protein n=1 Tax=Aspergillus cristatus TaxID=573508 RepID=A0A1E3BP27_ASPCR|nr:hypothetical protein SI65_00236 [Aspergillus cristatus]